MARRKKESSGEGGANWMDTYGDMVTLLLTFFVLLYASSSFDEGKWQYILQAFTSQGSIENPVVGPPKPSESDSAGFEFEDVLADGELPKTFDQLYQYLANYVQDNDLSDSVEVDKGKSNIYLKFRNSIFFGGDSDILLPTGSAVLDDIGKGLKAVDDKILVVKVLGHTAKSPGSTKDETILSSGRAVNVLMYLRDNDIVLKEKLMSVGMGSNRPIAPNDNEENRAKNRRVEIVIIRNDADFTDKDVIDELLSMEFGTDVVPPDDLPSDTSMTD